MRRALFCLLILLTAFRGMVGDAMAYSMTMGTTYQPIAQTHATESIAPLADSMPATELFSSKKATEMPCHQSADDATANSGNHACNACMVCHSPVLQRDVVAVSSAQMVTAYAASALGYWASAELVLDQKPPVS